MASITTTPAPRNAADAKQAADLMQRLAKLPPSVQYAVREAAIAAVDLVRSCDHTAAEALARVKEGSTLGAVSWAIVAEEVNRVAGEAVAAKRRPRYVEEMAAKLAESEAARDELAAKVADLAAYLNSEKFKGDHELSGYVNVNDVLTRLGLR